MSLEMQMTSTKCLVCNARNAKQHYGSWCCNGCKGFFWRTISSKRRYICLRNSVTSVGAILAKCEIEDGRRNSCRACRLKRCFEVGMDPNLIRDSWGKSTAALKQRNEQQSPSNFEADSPIAFLEGSPVKSENHLTEMDEMHRRPRLPSSANSANSPISIQNSSKQNLQLLADYLEWIQTIPELKLFNEQDKNCLIVNRARSLGWLILAAKHLNQQQIQQEQFGMEKLEALEAEIVNPLREMEVSKLELELLRLVSFFSTVPQMSADGKRMVQAIQSTYTRSLSEFSLKQSLQMEIGSLANVALRTSRIVHLLANVEKIAHQYD